MAAILNTAGWGTVQNRRTCRQLTAWLSNWRDRKRRTSSHSHSHQTAPIIRLEHISPGKLVNNWAASRLNRDFNLTCETFVGATGLVDVTIAILTIAIAILTIAIAGDARTDTHLRDGLGLGGQYV